MKKVLMLILMFVASFMLFACNDPQQTKKFTIEFETNGGSSIAKVEVENLADFNLPDDPEKVGFEFNGWYIDAEFTTIFTSLTGDGPFKLYAKWEEVVVEVKEFTISFSDGVESQKVKEGEKATKPADPTKEGFKFKGWFKDEACTEAYDFEALVNADVTLYAKWEEKVILPTKGTIEEVIAAADGLYETTAVVVAINAQSFLIKDETGLMLVYKGSGWECDLEIGDTVTVTGDTSSYAGAKQFGKTATYEKGEKVEVDYGTAKELTVAEIDAYATAETITPIYVKLVGTLSVSSGKYFNLTIEGAQAITGSLTYPAEADSLKALEGKKLEVYGYVTGVSSGKYLNILFTEYKQVLETYTITFKDTTTIMKLKEGSKVTQPANPNKTGHVFKGWYKDEACTEAYDFESLVTGDLTLYPKWEKNKYVINYNLDGGTCSNLITSFEYNDEVILPTPTKENQEFLGWYQGSTKVTKITNKNYSLIAKWGDIKYEVNYDLDGGLFEWGYKTSAEIGKAFYDDFCKYAGEEIDFDTFHNSSHPAIKTALVKKEMVDKWHWLWVYMYDHLKAYNGSDGGSYVADTYTGLELLIKGDIEIMGLATTAAGNARTLIRSYMHGVMHNMKGCGDANATFAKYSPDFSLKETQQGLVLNQFETTVKEVMNAELPTPIKEGYSFEGWFTADGTKVTHATADCSVKAKWVETCVVESITITNKITELEFLKTYQLEWAITPTEATNRLVEFESSNENAITVDDNGLITAVGKGEATIKIKSLSSSGKTDELTIKVIVPAYFDISYETNSYVKVNEKIQLNAEYIDGDTKGAIVWSTLNPEIADVTDEGKVTGLASGLATIRATVEGKADVYQDFYVTVVSAEISEALQFVLNEHESNIFTRYNLGIGAGVPNYYADIFGSVSQLLFEDLVIDTTYNKATNDKYGAELENRKMNSIEFVTVHYTAGFNTTAGGASHGSYFAKPLSEVSTSIHYSTGNDGIYKGLDEQYGAAHAGDGGAVETKNSFAWRDTPVVVLDTDPLFPVVTITSDATFAINGRDTGIKVPEETRYNRGYVTDSKWLNDFGIAVNVKDGKYQIGTAWWCYSEVLEGRICSNGGNANSIGIESAVNKGSDLWYTWQKTAMLVADIMIRHNLDITKVKGHHFYTAKDCPQPLLENDLEIWWEFIELVQAEYERQTKFADVKFEYATTSELLNDKGRVTGQELTSEVVTYTVTVTNGDSVETVTLASIIEGIYTK